MRILLTLASAAVVFAFGGPFQAANAQSFEIQDLTSPAGHSVWLVEDHSNPIVSVEITFNNGSYNDPQGLEGVSQVMGWLFNEGAGDLTANEYQGIMTDESFSIAAEAGFESTSVKMQFLTENQDLVFDMLALALEAPRFDADAIDRAKDYFTAQVIRRQNGPGQAFFQTYGPLQYGDEHPFLRYSNGTLESLEAIDRQDLLDVHARTYVTHGVEINAVGDITAPDLGLAIDKVLSSLPHGEPTGQRAAPSDPQSDIEVVTDYAQPVTFVTATANGISHKDPDLLAARVADQILGGDGLSSRLFQAVREEAGLVYGISSSLAAARDYGRVGFQFQTANESVDEALALTLEVFADFAQNGPTQEEVDRAKALITGGYPLRFQTSRDIAGYMSTMRVLDLPPEFPTYRNAQYDAVTLADVQAVAARLYGDPGFLIGMIGRPENRQPGVQSLND